MRRILMACLLLPLMLFVTACSDDEAGDPVAPRPVAERAVAADFDLPDLRNRQDAIALTDYRGRPLLINFWAHWCGPCRDEMPALARFAREHPDISVLGIAADPDAAANLAFADSVDVGFDLAIDGDGTVLGEYGISGLPGTVVVDRQGRVVNTIFGPLNDDELSRLAATLRAA